MVEIHYSLCHTPLPSIDPGTLFAFLPPQTMQTQKVSVSCLNNMFFGVVAEKGTEIDEIGRIGY